MPAWGSVACWTAPAGAVQNSSSFYCSHEWRLSDEGETRFRAKTRSQAAAGVCLTAHPTAAALLSDSCTRWASGNRIAARSLPSDRLLTCLVSGRPAVTEQQQQQQPGMGGEPLVGSWATVGSPSGGLRGAGARRPRSQTVTGLRCEAPALNEGLAACQQRPPSQQLQASGDGRQPGRATPACGCQAGRLLTVLFPPKNKAFQHRPSVTVPTRPDPLPLGTPSVLAFRRRALC